MDPDAPEVPPVSLKYLQDTTRAITDALVAFEVLPPEINVMVDDLQPQAQAAERWVRQIFQSDTVSAPVIKKAARFAEQLMAMARIPGRTVTMREKQWLLVVATLWNRAARFERAIEVYHEALEQDLCAEDCICAFRGLASIYKERKQTEQLEKVLKKTIEVYVRHELPDDVVLAKTFFEMACLNDRQDTRKKKLAKGAFVRCIDIYDQLGITNSQELTQSLICLAQHQDVAGDVIAAEENLVRAVELCKQFDDYNAGLFGIAASLRLEDLRKRQKKG